MEILIVLLLILIIGAVVIGIMLYNRFVTLRNRSENAWAQVDVQLRRRYDLIPNLVETVKGYASHERETFERVIQARAAGVQAKSVEEQGQAENLLTGALRQLFAVAEAYPELRANENFRALQDELTATEQQIAVSRQIYNDTVLRYNTAIQTFPGVLVAGPFGFNPRAYLEIEEVSRQPVAVDFSDMPGRDQPPPPGAGMPPTTGGPQAPEAGGQPPPAGGQPPQS